MMKPGEKRGRTLQVSCILVILLVWQGVRAQTPEMPRRGRDNTFILDGTVLDETDKPIPHARVNLGLLHSPGVSQAHTNSDGRFTFYRLGEGTYLLEIQAAGFQVHKEEISILATSRNVRLLLKSSDQEQNLADGPPGSISTAELQIPGKARKLYQKGLELHRRKNYTQALENFEKAQKAHPSFAAAFAAQGVTYLQLRRQDEAKAAFEKAIELDPDNFDARLGVGLIFNDLRRFEESQSHLLQARTRSGQGWQVHYELGRSCLGLGNYEEAQASFERASALQPSYPRLYLLLADSLLRQNKLEEALPVMDAYLRLEPDGALADRVRERIRAIQSRPPRGQGQ
jgi:tetratricopeptide (TPR) repeat protein